MHYLMTTEPPGCAQRLTTPLGICVAQIRRSCEARRSESPLPLSPLPLIAAQRLQARLHLVRQLRLHRSRLPLALTRAWRHCVPVATAAAAGARAAAAAAVLLPLCAVLVRICVLVIFSQRRVPPNGATKTSVACTCAL